LLVVQFLEEYIKKWNITQTSLKQLYCFEKEKSGIGYAPIQDRKEKKGEKQHELY